MGNKNKLSEGFGSVLKRHTFGESRMAAAERISKEAKARGIRDNIHLDAESTSSLIGKAGTGLKFMIAHPLATIGSLFGASTLYKAATNKNEPSNSNPFEDIQNYFASGKALGAGSLIFGLGLGAAGAFVDPTIGAALAVVGGLAGEPMLRMITGEKIDTKPTDGSKSATAKGATLQNSMDAVGSEVASTVESLTNSVSSFVAPTPTPTTEAARAAASVAQGGGL